jgi:hypothetical protein
VALAYRLSGDLLGHLCVVHLIGAMRVELLWPALQAVAELGGSASIGEIVETLIKREGFSDAQQAVLHNDGPETEIGYRLAWAHVPQGDGTADEQRPRRVGADG